MQATSNIRITVIYDHCHFDPVEQEMTKRISEIGPQEKIAFLVESRYYEIPSMNQYSLEFLGSDHTLSTSSCCMMLVAHMLCGRGAPTYLQTILSLMYSDRYFKTLFVEDHFLKYSPHKYGINNNDFSQLFNNLSSEQKLAIDNVKGCFKLLDKELPLQADAEKEVFLEGHLDACTSALLTYPLMDSSIFGPISEALAVIKLKQIETKLGQKFNAERDVSINQVKVLFNSDEETVNNLIEELNTTFRTQHQLQKIQIITNRILKQGEANTEEWNLIVRVGLSHREIMTNGLIEMFGTNNVKEVLFDETQPTDLDELVGNLSLVKL